MSATAEAPWQAQVVEQLGKHSLEVEAPDATHVAIWMPDALDEFNPLLLGTADSELAAIVLAEDAPSSRTDLFPGRGQVVKLDDLYRWHRQHEAGEPEVEIEAATIEPRRQNVEGDPDETVDVDEDESEVEETPEVPPGGQAAAFNASDYDREDLQIPKVDGESIDKIRVKFSGSVMLDRSSPADVALIRSLTLGKDAELRCAGKVDSVKTGFTTNREGDLDTVVLEKGIKVETVWVLTPEQLG